MGDLILLGSLVAAFVVPMVVRAKKWKRAMLSVPLCAALVPGAVAFNVFVTPAEPEFRVWWAIASITGSLYGLVAATIGYAVAAFAKRNDAV